MSKIRGRKYFLKKGWKENITRYVCRCELSRRYRVLFNIGIFGISLQKCKETYTAHENLRTESLGRDYTNWPQGVNYRVNYTITHAVPAVRFTLNSIKKKKKEKRKARWSDGKGGEGTLAANGIDWKDDARRSGGWLVSSKQRERMTVGGESRVREFRQRMKRWRERMRGVGGGLGGCQSSPN